MEEIHSATVATIGADGHPQTRVIDMMLWDDKGVYFLTAKGKEFYRQVMEQQFISVSATKGKVIMEKLFVGYVNARLDSYLMMLEIS